MATMYSPKLPKNPLLNALLVSTADLTRDFPLTSIPSEINKPSLIDRFPENKSSLSFNFGFGNAIENYSLNYGLNF